LAAQLSLIIQLSLVIQLNLIIQLSFIMTRSDLRAVRSDAICKIYEGFTLFAAFLGMRATEAQALL
jgi:hypothetical protein